MAPKIKVIDEKLIKDLAEIQCTMGEISTICGCSIDTLERRYAGVIKEGREHGKRSLRRAQYLKALEGNPAMLIWLGKHYLDQKESVTLLGTQEPEVRKLLQRWEDGRDLRTGVPFKPKQKPLELESAQPPDSSPEATE
jgi:hypothetical protein